MSMLKTKSLITLKPFLQNNNIDKQLAQRETNLGWITYFLMYIASGQV